MLDVDLGFGLLGDPSQVGGVLGARVVEVRAPARQRDLRPARRQADGRLDGVVTVTDDKGERPGVLGRIEDAGCGPCRDRHRDSRASESSRCAPSRR